MSRLLQFLPGLIGAVVAFIALLIMGWLQIESTWARFVLFLLVYAITAISLDRALTAYGKRQ